MKTEERHIQQTKHLEGHIGFVAGSLHGVTAPVFRKPGAFKSGAAKRVISGPHKIVPVTYGKAQMVFHAFAKHNFIRIIMPVSISGGRIRSNIGKWIGSGEKTLSHQLFLLNLSSAKSVAVQMSAAAFWLGFIA
jgi:NAD(P)H-hydrate repair Nnr-like enzyme with NAD(P)H-hydrate dehydratase domain